MTIKATRPLYTVRYRLNKQSKEVLSRVFKTLPEARRAFVRLSLVCPYVEIFNATTTEPIKAQWRV